MHDGIVDKLFSASSALWALVVMNAAALFRAWPSIMERINERRRDAASERAGDWSRLRDEVERLAHRVEALENKVEECERERDEWRVRAVTAEAILQGYGEARQIEAVEAAIKRLPKGEDNC